MSAWRGNALVYGEAAGMGSKRIGRTAGGRPIILDASDSKLRSWQGEMKAAMRATRPAAPVDGPIVVEIIVCVTRPASHYGTGRNAGTLKRNAPKRPATGRDIDKIARAVLDCMTAAGWVRDDSRVCDLRVSRHYAEYMTPGVASTDVQAWELEL